MPYVPRNNTNVCRKSSTTILGDALQTLFEINHNLGSEDVVVQVYDINGKQILVDTYILNNNSVSVEFDIAPDSEDVYKIIVIG